MFGAATTTIPRTREQARTQPQLRLGIRVFHPIFSLLLPWFLSCTVRSVVLLPLDVPVSCTELRQEVTRGRQRSPSWSSAETGFDWGCTDELGGFCSAQSRALPHPWHSQRQERWIFRAARPASSPGERGPCSDRSPGDTGNGTRLSVAAQGFFSTFVIAAFFPFWLLLMLFVSSKIASV